MIRMCIRIINFYAHFYCIGKKNKLLLKTLELTKYKKFYCIIMKLKYYKNIE